jgi:hypothetical protein
LLRALRSVFHRMAIAMKPYHRFVPAFARPVGAQGGPAPEFALATLYRLRQWKTGRIENVFRGGKQIRATENPGDIPGLAH